MGALASHAQACLINPSKCYKNRKLSVSSALKNDLLMSFFPTNYSTHLQPKFASVISLMMELVSSYVPKSKHNAKSVAS